MPVARLVLVVSSGTTFGEFSNTLTRLKPEIEKRCCKKVHLWTKMARNHSVKAAAEMDDEGIVFWVVPNARLNEILKGSPEIAVAMCITDDPHAGDMPGQRGKQIHSVVLRHIVTQATPQALENATRGNRSWLRDWFGGVSLSAPKDIHRFLRYRQYTSAQHTVEQLCLLDLMSTRVLRHAVQISLEHLVPPGLRVHTCKQSRRTTMVSHLTRSQTDFVPEGFADALCAQLSGMFPTDNSIRVIRTALDGEETSLNDVETLSKLIRAVRSRYDPCPAPEIQERLVTRLQEFSEGCSVCFQRGRRRSLLWLLRLLHLRHVLLTPPTLSLLSHSHCRSVRDHHRRDSGGCADALLSTTPTPQGTGKRAPFDLVAYLGRHTSNDHTQITNFVYAMHGLVRAEKRRFLIVAERNRNYHFTNDDVLEEHISRVSACTGIRMVNVDRLLTGKGSRFAPLKRLFDSDDPAPLGLVCSDARMLVGTNLDKVDALVAIGELPQRWLVQALGRVFRPLASRDNSQPMEMVRICT